MKMTLEEAELKLTAIAKLAEKWRAYPAGRGFNSVFQACAEELEAALTADKCSCTNPVTPAPAGKLTDDQLGEIGAKAIKGCAHGWSDINATFAAAVREAVEKEVLHNVAAKTRLWQIGAADREKKQAEEIARLTAEVSELEAKYMGMCTRLQECVQTHKLGLGGEKIDKLVVEAVAYLTAENTALSAGFTTLKADREGLSRAIVSEQAKKHDALAELAKANAKLERLWWRPVSVKPTREDADEGGFVTVLRGDKLTSIVQWDSNGFNPDFDWRQTSQALRYTKWRPAALPPAPIAEEASRAEFEAWAKQDGYNVERHKSGVYLYDGALAGWEAWQAARASAESKTLTQQEERA